MPCDQAMDFDSMFSIPEESEKGIALKNEMEEIPMASNALLTLEEFLNAENEGDCWPKNTFAPQPPPFRTQASDSWYVTSVTRDCSSDNYDSDGKASKQIVIRLPLKSRLHPTAEPPKQRDYINHNPSCITPDATELLNAPDFASRTEVCKEETTNKRKNCTVADNSVERTPKQIKAEIKETPASVTDTVTTKPQRKTRKPRTYKYDPKPLKRKDGKTNIPDELKDEEYWENRKRNNEAAKKSRQNRRAKELELISRMGRLEDENTSLKSKVEKLLALNAKLESKLSKL